MLMAADLLKHRVPDKRNEVMRPMKDVNKKYLLLLNGEIYNFKKYR